jgi:hypothetical protein
MLDLGGETFHGMAFGVSLGMNMMKLWKTQDVIVWDLGRRLIARHICGQSRTRGTDESASIVLVHSTFLTYGGLTPAAAVNYSIPSLYSAEALREATAPYKRLMEVRGSLQRLRLIKVSP